MLATMEERLRAQLPAIAAATGTGLALDRNWHSPAVPFHPACIAAVADAATSLGLPARAITSGAGHDAAYIARVAPTAMIFVPCADGISHNESESATREDVAAGADVLLQAVLAMDAGCGRIAPSKSMMGLAGLRSSSSRPRAGASRPPASHYFRPLQTMRLGNRDPADSCCP